MPGAWHRKIVKRLFYNHAGDLDLLLSYVEYGISCPEKLIQNIKSRSNIICALKETPTGKRVFALLDGGVHSGV